jgi:hypothetical protein
MLKRKAALKFVPKVDREFAGIVAPPVTLWENRTKPQEVSPSAGAAPPLHGSCKLADKIVVKEVSLMDQFKKNVLFIAVTISVLIGGAFAVNYSIQEHRRHLDELRVQWHKGNVKALKELSAIGTLSTEEQVRVDNAGDDSDRLQQVLIDIHQQRIISWNEVLEDVTSRQAKLEQLRHSSYTYSNYSNGVWLPPGNGSPILSKAVAEISGKVKDATDQLSHYTESLGLIRAWVPISFDNYMKKPTDSPANPSSGV